MGIFISHVRARSYLESVTSSLPAESAHEPDQSSHVSVFTVTQRARRMCIRQPKWKRTDQKIE